MFWFLGFRGLVSQHEAIKFKSQMFAKAGKVEEETPQMNTENIFQLYTNRLEGLKFKKNVKYSQLFRQFYYEINVAQLYKLQLI